MSDQITVLKLKSFNKRLMRQPPTDYCKDSLLFSCIFHASQKPEHKLMLPNNAQFGQHADQGTVKSLHDYDNTQFGQCWYVSNISLIDHLQVRLVTLTRSYFVMYSSASILMSSQSCSFILQCGQYTVIPKLLIHTAVWPVYWCHPKVTHSYCSVAGIFIREIVHKSLTDTAERF